MPVKGGEREKPTEPKGHAGFCFWPAPFFFMKKTPAAVDDGPDLRELKLMIPEADKSFVVIQISPLMADQPLCQPKKYMHVFTSKF